MSGQDPQDVLTVSESPSSFPTFFPSTEPTADPTTEAEFFANNWNPDAATIDDFDLSEDHYGPARIPLFVIGMAILHFVVLGFIRYLRRGEPHFFPPKKSPLSPKDRERHVMAKFLLSITTFAAWIFTIMWTSSCKFAQVGGKYQTTREERVAFGIFRAEDEEGLCEAMVVDDPARALNAARVFSIASCILMGLASFLILLLVCVHFFPERIQDQYFDIDRMYRLWIIGIALIYSAVWTTLYSFFIFGLEICHQPEFGFEGQKCKTGSGKLAIYNMIFMLFIIAVGIWYMWDALTPRPMTKEALESSLRHRGSKMMKRNSSKRMNVVEEDPPSETTHSQDEGNAGDNANGTHNNNKKSNKSKPATKKSKQDGVPISPKLPSHKNSVKTELLKKQAMNKAATGRKSTTSPNQPPPPKTTPPGSRGSSRSPKPGAKRSVSANNARTMNNANGAAERSPRPGATRNVTSANSTAGSKSPRGSRPSVGGNDNSSDATPRRGSRTGARSTTTSPSPRRPKRGSSQPTPRRSQATTTSSSPSSATPRKRKPRTPRSAGPGGRPSAAGGRGGGSQGMPAIPTL